MDTFFEKIKHATAARELAKHFRAQAKMLDQRAEFLEAKPNENYEHDLENKRLIQATYYCMKNNFENINYFAISIKFDVPERRLIAYCDMKKRALELESREKTRHAVYKMADKKLSQKKISNITGLSTSNVSAILRQRKLRIAAHEAGLQMTTFAKLWKQNKLSPKLLKTICKEDIVFR